MEIFDSLAGKTSAVLNIKTLKIVDNRNVEIQFKKQHFLRHNKFGLLISRGSVATYLRCSGQCYMGFAANFITFLAVKKLWPSYS